MLADGSSAAERAAKASPLLAVHFTLVKGHLLYRDGIRSVLVRWTDRRCLGAELAAERGLCQGGRIGVDREGAGTLGSPLL